MTADKSITTLVEELRALVEGYARQEVVAPARRLAQGLAMGIAGALLSAVGVVLLAIAGLRVLQTETGGRFDEGWSWAPYFLVATGLVLVLGLLGLGIARARRR